MNQLTFGLSLDELMALDKELFLTLEEAFVLAQEELTELARSERFDSVIAQAFGEGVDAEAVEEIRRQWASGEFAALPEVRVLSAEELPGARGAYAKELNQVFLSREFIAKNRGNVGEIVGVLLEEYGHFVDAQVNEVDAIGDEGDIFSRLVLGKILDRSQLELLRSEDDVISIKSFVASSKEEKISTEQANNSEDNAIEITKLLIFGTKKPSSVDFNSHIRAAGDKPDPIEYDMLDFMKYGGGRYAYPSLFGAIEKFFESKTILDKDKIYKGKAGRAELWNDLSLTSEDFKITISQYGTDYSPAMLGGIDHNERSYIFGTTDFKLDISSASFEVSNKTKSVKNIKVRAIDDNFDFKSGTSLAQLVNELALKPKLDPYGLARKAVPIKFTGSTGRNYEEYTQQDFDQNNYDGAFDYGDESVVSLRDKPKDTIGILGLTVSGPPYFLNILSDPFLSYRYKGLKVVYGTNGNDELYAYSFPLKDSAIDPPSNKTGFLPSLIAAGEGADFAVGSPYRDELQGGKGDDILLGDAGNDTLWGGEDNDHLDGGYGYDTAVFTDRFEAYQISLNNQDQFTFIHKNPIGVDDGIDTLTNIEQVRFIADGNIVNLIDIDGKLIDPENFKFAKKISKDKIQKIQDEIGEHLEKTKAVVTAFDEKIPIINRNLSSIIFANNTSKNTEVVGEASFSSIKSLLENELTLEASQDLESKAKDFVSQLIEAIDETLTFLEEFEDGIPVEYIQELFYQNLGSDGLNVLQSRSDITITNTDEQLRFDLNLSSEPTSYSLPIDTKFGIPGLGLTIEESSEIEVDFSYKFNFGFGIDAQGDFFFDTSKRDDDLKILLNAGIPNIQMEGELGFFKVEIQDEESKDVDNDDVSPSNLDLGFVFDLDSEQTGPPLDIDGSANLNLNLNTKVNIGNTEETESDNTQESKSDNSSLLPYISTDLNVAWDFQEGLTPKKIVFDNVGLRLGSLLGGITGTVLDPIGEILSPVDPILGWLKKDIPVLGKDVLEIAQLLEKDGAEEASLFVDTIESVEKVNKILQDLDEGLIELGSYTIPFSNEINDKSAEPGSKNIYEGITINPKDSNDSSTNLGKSSELDGFYSVSEENDLFKFPILENPEAVVSLLLGDPNVELFKLDLPPIALNLGYSQSIPIFGPIFAEIGGDIEFAGDIDFGYDSSGFLAFQETNYNPNEIDQLAQGFYISSGEPSTALEILPKDQDFALGFGTGIEANVGVSAGIVSAKVGGGIKGYALANLTDPKTRIENLSSPGCIFELSGGIDAVVAAKLKIGYGWFSRTKRIEIVRVTLADFHKGCEGHKVHKDINQATDDTGGLLTLNVGNRSDRVNVDKDKKTEDETFLVKHIGGVEGNETVSVIAYGVNKEYSPINTIYADAGGGNDLIELDADVISTAELNGGTGDDVLRGGSGDDTLNGNSGDDDLFGRAGTDTLYGESGDDYLEGGAGDDELYGGADSDFLEGGAGNDTLDGGAGFDSVSYTTAPNGVEIDLSLGEDSYVRDGTGGIDILRNIEQIEGSYHNDEIRAGSENNVIDGLAGDDEIHGGDGNDFIVGGLGGDTLYGGKGEDSTSYASSSAQVRVNLQTSFAFGGEADGDQLFGIENVQGSLYDDELIGDEYDNKIEGAEGNDKISGGAGNDTLSGGSNRNSIPEQDWLVYSNAPNGVKVSLKKGLAEEDGFGNQDVIEKAVIIKNYGPKNLSNSESEVEETEYSSFENLEGSDYSDELEGDIGDNIIEGNDGNDIIKGDEGDDTLKGGLGADHFDGGIGEDWADYSDAKKGVSINLVTGGYRGEAAGDTFEKSPDGISTTENLRGTDNGDNLVGDSGDNTFDPGLSKGEIDYVNGAGGKDLLFLDYSTNDWGTGITGGFSSASSTSGFLSRLKPEEGDVLDAVMFSSIESSHITGTIQDDNIQGGAGVDTIFSGAGNDDVRGGDGDDVIYADEGDDTLTGGVGEDELNGQAGQDTASYATASSAVSVDLKDNIQKDSNSDAFGDKLISIENLEGSAYGDTLTGDEKANRLSGLAGNDRLNGGVGADILDGGDGTDEVTYEESSAGIQIALSSTSIGRGGDAEGDIFAGIENATGSKHDDFIEGNKKDNKLVGAEGSDFLIGKAGNDSLYGGDGEDTLEGGQDNDLLDGGAEVDILNGGNGIDTASYKMAKNGVIVDLKKGAEYEEEEHYFQKDVLISIENIEGSEHADILTGDEQSNHLIGHAGSDSLNGAEGNDQLDSGDGSDYLVGGEGADHLDGGAGSDRASYISSNEGVAIDLLAGVAEGGHAEGDTLNDIENITGSEYADALKGDNLNNSLSGESGNDFLSGQAGDDFLIGGAGADVIFGNSGKDWVSYIGSSGVEINLAAGTAKNGHAEGDILVSIENVEGSSYNDILVGNTESNILKGLSGRDILRGDTRQSINRTDQRHQISSNQIDTLTGGSGKDEFWLTDVHPIQSTYKNINYYYSNTGQLANFYEHDGDSDYALITDFDPNEGDTIHIEFGTYDFLETNGSLPSGIGIYKSSSNELIAIVQGSPLLDISQNYFQQYMSFDNS